MRVERVIVWVVLAVVLGLTPEAIGQGGSPAELRQEIQRLQRDNESLRVALEELRSSHQALLVELERLRRAVADRAAASAERPAGPSGSGEPGGSTDRSADQKTSPGDLTVGSLDPLASPEALFVALSVSYSDAIWDQAPPGRREGWLPDPALVRAWALSVPSELTGQTEWMTRLRLIDMEEPGGPRRASVVVLDRATLGPISERFAVDMPDRFVTRIEKLLKTQDAPVLWELRVAVRPEPVFDAHRERAGPFNYPPLIGPFAGFDFSVEVLGVGAVTEAQARDAASQGEDESEPVQR